MSVIFRSVIVSLVTTVLALYLILPAGGWIAVVLYNLLYDHYPPGRWYGFVDALNVTAYWSSQSLYLGERFAAINFLVCMIAAALPLLVALWLFHRKAY